ncbi:hypothetical protein A2V68_02210 [candidate division Kazan bacterium RBG_13_50_9]|uniref:HIT domain-containing protein n=1 Tax=candidate division Kazan bacterium RBG_13_50_9 TaxID=1798535 RepID=A0A1F4NRY4_UNCK3|nr:MAG: hypothetical protein A2V68_02210 [candidate division Kazan bacterium RBG_13_50_9]
MKIKEYRYWNLFLNENQSYLGRCVLMLEREGANFLVDTTQEERDELFQILGEWQEALTELWHPDWWNYAQLGNVTPQLHFHLVPRYKEPREFGGEKFVDEKWGHDYAPAPKREVDRTLNRAIAGEIKTKLLSNILPQTNR